jgi:hypothetical protein
MANAVERSATIQAARVPVIAIPISSDRATVEMITFRIPASSPPSTGCTMRVAQTAVDLVVAGAVGMETG